MYKCSYCGVKFDEPASVQEDMYHTEVGATEHLYTSVCPICGSEEFYEIYDDDEEDDEENDQK